MQIDSVALAQYGEPPWSVFFALPLCAPPASSEVVIVGGGITGLSAAISLAARGVDVVVVDRRIGGGASLRSGGIILGETLVGPDAQFDGCDRTLRTWIDGEGVACDAVWSSCLELSRDARLPIPVNAWSDHGTLRIADEVPAGALDPGKLIDGLLAAGCRAGARLIDALPVQSITAESQRVRVIAGDTPILADHVIMAVDAVSWRRGFDPWQARTLTVALQTAADPHLASAIGLHQPFYTREAPLLWGRSLADGSLLFGRELIEWPGSASPGDPGRQFAASVDRLTARVRGLHAGLQVVAIQRAWAGPTARTSSGVPALVEDPDLPGVVWAGGYGGHGLAQSFVLGRAAADHVSRLRT